MYQFTKPFKEIQAFNKVEARHGRSGESCSVRIFDKAKLSPEELVKLRIEFFITNMVRHSYIAEIQNFFELDDRIYNVTEASKDETLAMVMRGQAMNEVDCVRVVK